MPEQLSSLAAPFLKWAGGKGQLLDQYEPFFPTRPRRAYFEPFVGSGAVFFRLRARNLFSEYVLSDSNPDLITCYRVVRDELRDLLSLLAEHQAEHSARGRDYYERVRAWDRSPLWAEVPDVIRAARMIYLNKTCYNGLWRVNRQGYFNVPMGRYANPDILNVERLQAASQALQGVTLAVCDFEQVIYQAAAGDFVYFDPPYFPLSETANFTSYSPHEFGIYEQQKLALVFAALHRKGCLVMESNSDTPFVRELYAGYRVETVEARRAINSHVGRRGAISEVVITNYGAM